MSLECPQCYHADMNRTSMVLKWGPTSVEGLSQRQVHRCVQDHVQRYGRMQHLHLLYACLIDFEHIYNTQYKYYLYNEISLLQ